MGGSEKTRIGLIGTVMEKMKLIKMEDSSETIVQSRVEFVFLKLLANE